MRMVRNSIFVGGLALLGTLALSSEVLAAGDAAKGADVFKRCAICHNAQSGAGNKIGPNLFGVVGRPAGTFAGYSYSTAMKNSGLTWTAENLADYVTDPKKKVPGNKMSYAGLSDAAQVADLIAYLSTLK